MIFNHGKYFRNTSLSCKRLNSILQANEVEDTLKRIQSHKGVVGIIVVNSEGKIIIFEHFHFI